MKSDGAILITVVLSKNGIQNAALIYRGDVARLKNVLVHRNTVNKKGRSTSSSSIFACNNSRGIVGDGSKLRHVPWLNPYQPAIGRKRV
jgi:hypothetical protein